MFEKRLLYTFTHIPPVMKRGSHALIVIQDSEGRYILGDKDIYPDGIARFVGGGISARKDPQVEASRELEEELNIKVRLESLTPIAVVTAKIQEGPTQKQFLFTTHIFHYRLEPNEKIQPASDLDGIVTLDAGQMRKLLKNFQKLSNELVDVGKVGKGQFRWSDYGKLYGELHRLGFELTQEKQI